MNTTSHYQLNQWDGPDRILRTDFNADNLKTDDAVATVQADVDALTPKAGAQLLKTVNLNSSSSSWTVSLSSINWDTWREVHVFLDPYSQSGVRLAPYVRGTKLTSLDANNSLSNNLRTMGHLIFFPMFDRRQYLTYLFLGSFNPGFHQDTSWSYDYLTDIVFKTESGTLDPGSKVTIWGVK